MRAAGGDRSGGPSSWRQAPQPVPTVSGAGSAASGPAASGPAASGRPITARPRARAGLPVALLAVAGYSIFAQGAIDIPQGTYAQVALAVIALVAAALGLGPGRVAITADRRAWAGLGLLGAFAVWNGLSLLWTVAPEDTWLQTNRAIAYALMVALALAVGSGSRQAVERLALGWLAIAVLAALYALGGKVAPGVHVDGVVNLDHTAVFSRLRAPLDYWNALALMCVLAVPVAIVLAADRSRPARLRLAALTSLSVLLMVTGLTYSRGGVLAVVVAIVALTALGGEARLRGLAVAGLGALAAAPGLALAFSLSSLTTDGVPLGRRGHDGLILGLVVLASLAVLIVGARRLLALESRMTWSPARSRRAWRALATGAAALVVVGVLALAVSSRGLLGSIGHQVSAFTQVRKDPITDPARLLSTSSGNRWVWWKEALGAFSDRPVQGWGAGSFPVTHLLYRQPPPLPVRQPHNVALQFLAETGLVGALLALGGTLALLAAALARIRGMAPGRRRDYSVALVAAAVAWLVHGAFDWDWDIPAVTFPPLLFLGVIAAAPPPSLPPRRDRLSTAALTAGRPASLPAVALVFVSLLLVAVAVSAILPAWSQSKALNAIASVGDSATPAQLQRAAAAADLASRLDPLSDQAPIDAATIAARRGSPADQRRYLLEAVSREPYDANAWLRLAAASAAQRDVAASRRALRRALSVDPLSPFLLYLSRADQAYEERSAASATATPTPLPEPVAPISTSVPGAAPPPILSAPAPAVPIRPSPALRAPPPGG